jgi:hypothetical protein
LNLEQELDGLYERPLEEFTAARNELARRLKLEGDPRADEVRRLAKPTLPVWAINRLARREPLAVRRLLGAGAALRKAQERALQGRGAAGLAEAQSEERDALRLLGDRARALLAESGKAASEATLERIVSTLGAAAVDEAARPLLKAGRLEAELEPAGFGALVGISVSPRRRAAATGTVDRKREHTAREAERAAERAEAEARARREAAVRARAAADKAAAELQDR